MDSKWEAYKFHCSCLPQLMTNGRAKTELLGETAKSFLRELWIEERYDRRKYDNVNKYTNKGIMVESDSLEMVSEVLGTSLFKNKKTFENDFIIGTPDVASPLIDVKSSWDIWSYFNVDMKRATSDYEWQMNGYMWLTDSSHARLIYALVNTPLEMTETELYKMSFTFPDRIVEEARKNYEYDDIPKPNRVKVFEYYATEEQREAIEKQVIAARLYLDQLDKAVGLGTAVLHPTR